MIKNNKKMLRLCTKSLNSELNDADKQCLEKWLAASEQNRRIYEEIKQVWIHSKPPVIPDIPDIDKEWLNLSAEIQLKSFEKKSIAGDFLKSFIRGLGIIFSKKYAFVFSAAIVLIITGLFLWDQYFTSNFFNVTTAKGEKTLITLSDGTKVHLNCESSLRCSHRYGIKNREVYLQGEAFFEVKKQSQSFVVITPNASTKVLGTKFNVRARGDETEVVVESGTVQLEKIDKSKDSVTLKKGEMGLITGKKPPDKINTIDTKVALGWMKGNLYFRKKPLNEVMEELSRVYDVSIQISDTTLIDHTLTATFSNLPFNNVINSICLTLGAEYKFENDVYVIY